MTLAVEINDAGLVLARDGRIVAEEPGCAMLDGPEPETGTAALGRARLKPLHAETRYWQDLDTAGLQRESRAAASHAEIAHAQLLALARAAGGGGDTLYAVPPWYTREQLAVLLGVAREAGMPAVGLVDAGLAAAALEPVPAFALQLEMTLHRTVITQLEHAGDLRRVRHELLLQHGWLALQQAWVDRIAATFVRKTRYDPLHEAAGEQRLWDGLPEWLAALERGGSVTVALPAAGATLAVELTRGDVEDAARGIYDAVAQSLQRARPEGGALHVRVSHRWARMPGFMERLGDLRDCGLNVLPRGAAALGALAFERTLRRDPAQLTLVQRLPVSAARGPAAPAALPRVAPQDAPTHVVHLGRAWRLAGTALHVGASVPAGQRGIAVAAGPGVSRVHCRLVGDAEGVWLEDLSTYGTFLNGERIGGRVALRAGDRLRIGTPGVSLELVRVVDGDGTA
jgi:hypothetical protein